MLWGICKDGFEVLGYSEVLMITGVTRYRIWSRYFLRDRTCAINLRRVVSNVVS